MLTDPWQPLFFTLVKDNSNRPWKRLCLATGTKDGYRIERLSVCAVLAFHYVLESGLTLGSVDLPLYAESEFTLLQTCL